MAVRRATPASRFEYPVAAWRFAGWPHCARNGGRHLHDVPVLCRLPWGVHGSGAGPQLRLEQLNLLILGPPNRNESTARRPGARRDFTVMDVYYAMVPMFAVRRLVEHCAPQCSCITI